MRKREHREGWKERERGKESEKARRKIERKFRIMEVMFSTGLVVIEL